MTTSITSIGDRTQMWGSNGTVDTQSLLELELQVEQAKSLPYTQQKGYFTTEKNAWVDLQTQMQTFQTAVQGMKDYLVNNQKKVTLSTDGFASVTASGTAVNGSFQLNVQQMATQHKILGDSKGDATAPLGYDATVQINGKDLVLNATMSMQDMVNTINAGGYGIRANAISGSLVLTSEKTGAANAITLTDATTSSGVNVFEDLGLVTSTGAFKHELQQAKDAIIQVDGVTLTQADNTFKSVMNGVDITVLKENSGDMTATVDTDATDQVSHIKNFIDAYNKIITYLHDDTKKDGALQGKEVAVNLKRDMGTFLQQMGGTSLHAFDVGISLGKYSSDGANGVLTFDETKFKDALAQNPDTVRDLLQGTDGMITKLYNVVNDALKTDGSLPTKIDGVTKTIDGIDKALTRMDDEYQRRQEYIIQKYSTFESLMTQLNFQSDFMTAQLKAMSGDTSSN